MAEWEKTTLEKCTDILGDGLHGIPKYTDGGEYAFINGNNLVNGEILIKKDTKMVDYSQYEKYKKPLTNRTLLVSINGTLGNVGMYNSEKIILGKSACYFNVKEFVDKDFIYYVVSSPMFRQYLEHSATGTTIKNISLKQMREYEFLLPPIEKQKQISSVLKMIDEKIKNNRRVNENLYVQAQAIKKQWVATNEDGYQLLPLADVATINPDTYSPKEAWRYVNYLDTSSITNGVIANIQRIVPSNEKLPSRARRKVVAGDVLFSTVRPNQNHFGIISDPLPNMLASTGFAVIRSKNFLVCNELIYLCITERNFVEKMQQLAEQSTSTFPSIKPSDLETCQIPCPKDENSAAFTNTLKYLFDLIAINIHENNSLAAMRDTLLPKLMSGEIDISAINL